MESFQIMDEGIIPGIIPGSEISPESFQKQYPKLRLMLRNEASSLAGEPHVSKPEARLRMELNAELEIEQYHDKRRRKRRKI